MKGRRITKTVEERTKDLKTAFRRSALTSFEIVKLLADWYGWTSINIGACGTHTLFAKDLDGKWGEA
jgi:hypothetical protein